VGHAEKGDIADDVEIRVLQLLHRIDFQPVQRLAEIRASAG